MSFSNCSIRRSCSAIRPRSSGGHGDSDPEFATDSPYFKLMDFLVRRDGEPLLVKNTRNAFTSTNLQELLGEKAWSRSLGREPQERIHLHPEALKGRQRTVSRTAAVAPFGASMGAGTPLSQ